MQAPTARTGATKASVHWLIDILFSVNEEQLSKQLNSHGDV